MHSMVNYFLTDIYTKLYLEYYFRLLYNVYNMEVVHVIFFFFFGSHDKFLALPLPLKKKKIMELPLCSPKFFPINRPISTTSLVLDKPLNDDFYYIK